MENAAEILVVDDEPAVALAIKSALKFCGFSVLTASGGEAALAAIQAQPSRFALVISDHNMPGMSGLTFVHALRDGGFSVRIVILSAFLSSDIEAQYEALGVDQILSKPFNIARLRAAVEAALHQPVS